MSLDEVDAELYKLINTDITQWKARKYVYNLDIVSYQEIEEKEYYVPLLDFETSCPHEVKHEHRYTDGTYVSCYASKLDFYTRFLKWRREYISKTQVEEPPLGSDDKKMNQTAIEIITAAFTGNNFQQPIHLFKTYQKGIQMELNKNTLTRDRFYYDFRNNIWTTKQKLLHNNDAFSIDMNPYFDVFYKIIGQIIFRVRRKFPISMKFFAQLSTISLFGKNNIETPNIDSDTLTLLLNNYYKSIHKSSSYIFNLTILDWEPSTSNESDIPRITGEYLNLSAPTFIEMISRINTINRVYLLV
jgi:hypothetical protein